MGQAANVERQRSASPSLAAFCLVAASPFRDFQSLPCHLLGDDLIRAKGAVQLDTPL
jgi:hypothetical protein